MKATGTYEAVKDVDPQVILSVRTREQIDHWVAKFPPDRKRSDPFGGVYKKLVLKDDKLIGACLYGDTVDGSYRYSRRSCGPF